jgi:hypothetical protein
MCDYSTIETNVNSNHGHMRANKNIRRGAMKHQSKFGRLVGAERIVKPTRWVGFFTWLNGWDKGT